MGSGTPAWEVDQGGEREQLQIGSLWTPRSRKHRAQEVSRMQSTLAEIGGMFQSFSAIVSEQENLIARIDADTEAASVNVDEGHSQINKYQKSIQGNRSFIIKAFIVLFCFIILFGTVFR